MLKCVQLNKGKDHRRVKKSGVLLRRCAALIAFIAFSGVQGAEPAKPLLFRDPSLSETEVAFGYAGNIWVANRDGKRARALTSGSHEEGPIFSPNGSQIAFMGAYDGAHGVYVVPAAGGEPRRLTFHPADLKVVGWTPDGERVVFSSTRAAFDNKVVQLFTVPVEGGAATIVPLARAAAASFSPDAKRIAYVPIIQSESWWKRYRGGRTEAIWIASLADSSIQASIPRDNSNDFNPMWVGDVIYFLSDRNGGAITLFSYDLKSQQVKQVVKNEGLDITSAAASFGTIVYSRFGSLHLLDLKSGRDRAVEIQPIADLPETKPHFRKIEPNQLYMADIAPNGAGAVFGVRGEILTAAVDAADIRNLTNTTGVVERDPAWSPDGTSIAYFSDESGEYGLHIRDAGGKGNVRKINLGNPASFFYSPRWSPDSKRVGYTDKRLNYWYVDLDKKIPVRVDTDMSVDPAPPDSANPAHGLQLAWSPSSQWIAYTKQLRNHLHAIFVYSIEQAKSFQLTDGMSDAFHPAFDKNGEYLYFTASTDTGLTTGVEGMSSMQHPVTRSVYAVQLKKDMLPSVDAKSDKVAQSTAENAAKRRPQETKTMRAGIDLDGIGQRIHPLPVPARNYYGLFAGKPGVLFLLEGPQVDPVLSSGNASSRSTKVQKFDSKTRKTEEILGGASFFNTSYPSESVTSFHLSFNGEKMLYSTRDQWFIAPAETAAAARRPLALDSMRVYVDPRAEWRHMFEQVWRDERDFFYDPGLHGLNLAEVKKRYEPYLQGIATRDDLNFLFKEMLGNLSVGHMYISGGDIPSPKTAKLGLLGADYSVENGRYRFARVYGGDTWNPELHSPLTECGVSVQAGEYLLAVNGREVRPSADVYSFFEGTAGKETVLKIGPNPGLGGSRDVTVTPVGDEIPVRNYAWVEGNRRKVEELTQGRVAYVYIPDTFAGGYTNFNRYYFAQVGKEAVIIDERYNHGGNIPDYIIDNLRRPLNFYFATREGDDIASPLESIFGPKVMIINEMAGSGGDVLPAMFRQAGLGPLIGKRTWGGGVGFYGLPGDLLDGGFVATPNLAAYSPDGNWLIENYGVAPDIDVEDDPQAVRQGHDPQLEKAVEVIMKLLQEHHSPQASGHPPFPNYQKSLAH
jgi:tricorn protease